MASWVNELVKVVESGEKVKKGAEGWRDVANEMAPFSAPIIQFLRNLLGGRTGALLLQRKERRPSRATRR